MAQLGEEELDLLRAALIGFEHSLAVIDQHIADLRGELDGRSQPGGRRALSAAARRRIAEAQKQRWANQRQDAAASPARKPARRKLSPQGRARIIAATKKRWAEFRKAKAAAAGPKKTHRKAASRNTSPPAAPPAAAPVVVSES